jgi:hypothetical protein
MRDEGQGMRDEREAEGRRFWVYFVVPYIPNVA